MAVAQAQLIGKAFIIYGTVKAVAANGTERLLAPNSPIYAGERIVTGPDGSVSIVFNDNASHLDLGRMSDVLIDQDVYAGAGLDPASDAVAQAGEIQAALESGGIDPTTQFPPPAAGPGVVGPRGGGRQIVVFEADQMEVLPDSGAETTGVGLTFLDPPGGLVTEPEEVIIPVSAAPAATPTPTASVNPTPSPTLTPPPSPTPTPTPIPPPPPPNDVPLILLRPIAFGVEEDALENALSVGIRDSANDTDTVTMDLAPLVTVDFGADGPGTIVFSLLDPNGAASGLTSKGVAVVYQQNGDAIEAWAGDRLVFTYAVAPSGEAVFTLHDQLDHPPASGDDGLLIITNLGQYVQVTATDTDGDAVTLPFTGLITVSVENDVPELVLARQGVSGAVQEDALGSQTLGNTADADLSVGNLDTPDDTDVVVLDLSGLVNVRPGADEPAPVVFTVISGTQPVGLTSKGETVNYAVDAATNTVTATAGGRVVFTFVVDSATGLATFDLNDQVDHAPGSGDDATLSLELGSWVQASVTDYDGDTVSQALTGLITVTVENDVPFLEILGEGVIGLVHEDALGQLTGNPQNNADLDLSTGIPESETMTDSITLQLSSMVNTRPGADEPAPPVYSIVDPNSAPSGLTSKGQVVTYQLSTTDANTLLAVAADGRIVFTFSVNEISGEVTFNLNDQLDHQGYGDGEILPIQNLGEYVQVSVTDFDGDTATDTFAGLIEIQVENDVPMANVDALPIQAIVAEDGMSYATGDGSEGNKESGETNDADESSGAAGSLTALFSAGADEGLGYGITTDGGILGGLDPLYSQGEMLTYSSTGSVLTASAGGREVFTFTVNDDGSWSFDLKDQLDHVDDGSNTENTALVSGADGSGSVAGIDFSSVLTATDFDGDTVTGSAAGTFVVTVVDDVPELEIMGEGVIGVVHEDALNATDSVDPDLSTGIPEPGVVVQDMVTLQLAPMVRTAPGADEPAPPVYSIVDPNDAASGLTSNGQVVTYQLSTTDANTLLAVAADGRTVFTFSVNEISGEVTFNLNDQLDHQGYGDGEILPIQNLGEYVQVSVTDFDGDTVTDTFAGLIEIQVENDVPTTDADDAILGYDIGSTMTESFNNFPGADELISDITFNLTEGAPVLSDVGQMTSDGTGLVWHIDQATGNLQAVKSGDASSVPVFTVTTDKTPGGEYAGTYTVDIAGPVDNGSEAVSYTLSSAPSGNGLDVIITGAQIGYDPITIYADALQPTNGSVNVSSQGVGVNNQFIDSSEVLSFKFYSDSARTSPLVVAALGFTVNHLSNSELAHFTLWSDGSQVGTRVSKAGATRGDNATNRTPLTVTAADAGEPAGATFDEIRFEGTGVNNGYRLLISSLIVTTEPLDQQIAIPYTVTDADGDTDSSEFSVVFLNAGQLTPNPVVSDNDSDGEGASATMNIMDAAVLVPEEHQPADTNSESEEWSAEGDDSAGGGEGDGAGLPVTAADGEPSSGEAPDAAGDTGPDQVVGMTSAGAENSEVVDPAAGPSLDPEGDSGQVVAAAGDVAESPASAVVQDNNDPSLDIDLQTGATDGDSAQLAAADGSAQPVGGSEVKTGETGQVTGTTDGDVVDSAQQPVVAVSEPATTDSQAGLGGSEAGGDNQPSEAVGSVETLAGAASDEDGATDDLPDELFAGDGGEDEVSTDALDADLDGGGVDSGFDMDALVPPPESGQIG